MRIAFLWDGIEEHMDKRWNDGLRLAMKHLEKRHKVGYFEPLDRRGIDEFKPDVLLHWAALCENSKPTVVEYPYKKAICFGGGPVDNSNVHGYDMYFSESEVNDVDFEEHGKRWMRAFGIN